MSYRDDLRAYLTDNPEGYWFKAKLYGWGWMPVTKEGWAVTIFFMVAIIGNAVRLTHGGAIDAATSKALIIETTLLVAVLILICIARGERPHWQWGPPKARRDSDVNAQ